MIEQQIEVLDSDLKAARAMLCAFPRDAASPLHTITVHFAEQLDGSHQALDAITAQVGTRAPEVSWRELAALQEAVRGMLRELLTTLEGALLREASEGVSDDASYILADRLLRGLGKKTDIIWPRFTIPAEGEYFAPTLDIIGIRFPESTIWDLPVAAHEFGHFVGPRIPSPIPGQDPSLELLLNAPPGGVSPAHLLEYFADVFATFAMGISYPMTCALLRWNPASEEAMDGTNTHPPQRLRAALIFRVARRYVEAVDSQEWKQALSDTQATWEDNLQAATGITELTAEEQLLIDVLDETLTPIVERKNQAGYEGSLRALQLLLGFGNDGWGIPVPPANCTMRDVLNAAWLARRRWPAVTRRIEETASRLCRALPEEPV